MSLLNVVSGAVFGSGSLENEDLPPSDPTSGSEATESDEDSPVDFGPSGPILPGKGSAYTSDAMTVKASTGSDSKSDDDSLVDFGLPPPPPNDASLDFRGPVTDTESDNGSLVDFGSSAALPNMPNRDHRAPDPDQSSDDDSLIDFGSSLALPRMESQYSHNSVLSGMLSMPVR